MRLERCLIFVLLTLFAVMILSIVESVKATYPFWTIRLLGGVLFLSGMLIMAYNMWRTIRTETETVATHSQPALAA